MKLYLADIKKSIESKLYSRAKLNVYIHISSKFKRTEDVQRICYGIQVYRSLSTKWNIPMK